MDEESARTSSQPIAQWQSERAGGPDALQLLSSEQTPLLLKSNVPQPLRTPLPWKQLFILFWVQLAEPLTSQVIYPFINKMVRDMPITGGDEAKMGYYAGVIESSFSVTQALTVLYWSRLSDRVGRRPIILLGLLGLTLSTACFGVSSTFWGLILSRCLSGALNGNAGVIKSMMGEITDETTIAQAMALLPVIWNVGATIGPVIGGWLSNPHERFPSLFPGHFWKAYPYALPCFVVAIYCAGTLISTFFLLEEIYMVSMFMFIPIWVLFPMMSASLGEDKLINALTWVELALQIILYVIMDMGFSSAFIYVRASAPNAYSLGVTNGLAQTGVSIARAIGPASATSLFALSVQISRGAHTKPGLAFRWLGANLVYEIFILISVGAVIAVRRLPEKLELSKANEEVDVNGNEL